MWENLRDLDRWWEKWKVRFFMFSGCEKMIENLSIYRSRHGINLEVICGLLNSLNRLGTSNYWLVMPKVEDFDIESLKKH